jgi:hypothetical protein
MNRTFLQLALAISFSTQLAEVADCQIADRGLPGQDYYANFGNYYGAEYQDALRGFVRGGNSAFRIGDARFLDSACYWTMAGECHYQSGNYAEALAFYEQALALILDFAKGDWQERIQPLAIENFQADTAAFQKANVNWYRSTRNQGAARIPRSFTVLFGRLDAARALVEGGPVQNPELRRVDHAEIMRCATIAVYRRFLIKGITCQIDPLTSNMVADFGRLPTDILVVGRWNSILSGLADLSAGRPDRAIPKLQRGLTLENGLDHHLTPIALLGLAVSARQRGDSASAAQFCLEASHSAAVFEQYDLISDALSLGNELHLAESNSVYPPLVPAIQWVSRNRPRLLWTSLLVNLADGLIETEDLENAKKTLAEIKRATARTSLGTSRWAGEARFLSASIAFQELRDDSAELATALELLQRSSTWLFQLNLVANSAAAGSITHRQTELIYEKLLFDPKAPHWRSDPRGTLAFLTAPHVGFMEKWFEILVARKNTDKALEVAELIRRHRFYESIPLAGRLLAMRWTFTAPEELLDPDAIQQRRDFFQRYPRFAQSVQRIVELQDQLRTLPLKPDTDSPQQKQQQELLVEIMNLSRYQDSVIAAAALRRIPADYVFPEATDFSQTVKGIQPHQVMLAAIQSYSGYHLYAVTEQSRRYLGVFRERDVRKLVSQLYKQMGITDKDSGVDAAVLSSDQWKPAAAELKSKLLAEFHDDQWTNYQELIVVPDGVLWYVPFEILQIGAKQADWKNLGDSLKIRYLPMVTCLASSRHQFPDGNRVAVVTGKLHDKGTTDLVQRQFESLKDSITTVSQFSQPSKIPSDLLNTTVDTLMVWNETRELGKSGIYGWAPFQLDQGRRGSTLADWMQSPWRGPQRMVLPTFVSGAAGGLKSNSNGSELFLSACGLLASGVRSVFISRWRVGGENSLALSQQFLLDARKTSDVEGMQTSRSAMQNSDLNLANEARIKPSKQNPDTFKAEHPFFWAGNMLIDLDGYRPADGDENPIAAPPNAADP